MHYNTNYKYQLELPTPEQNTIHWFHNSVHPWIVEHILEIDLIVKAAVVVGTVAPHLDWECSYHSVFVVDSHVHERNCGL